MARRESISVRLLQLSAIILIATSFNYIDKDLRVAEGAHITRTHTIYRIVPIALVALLSALSSPRQIGNIFRQMLNPPILWWTWFAVVAIVSGFLSDVAPLWSAWKCTELLVAMFWASAVLVASYREGSGRVVEKCFEAVIGFCYLITIWALTCTILDGPMPYLTGAKRLELEWPGINAINLSVIAAFAIVGIWIQFRKLNPLVILTIIGPPMMLLIMSRSRTGLVGLGLAGGYSIFTQRVKASSRLIFVVFLIAIVAAFFFNEDLRESFRMSSMKQVMKLSGRVEAETGDSAWAECINLIHESPMIGHGFLNITKHMYHGKRVVGDNGFLHALVSAGFVGRCR